MQYGSRAHALVDLASSAIAGDFSRSWAWAQLGIWRSDFPLRADVAAELVVRALVKEPTHAVAVVAYLAREQADRFRDLIARATPGAWAALAHAAVVAAGADQEDVVPGARDAAAADAREVMDPGERTSAPLARRVVTHSAIARASIDRFARVPGELRRALAALALLEVEPSAVRGVDGAHWLPAIERAMTIAANQVTVSVLAAHVGEIPNADTRRSGQIAGEKVARVGEAAQALDAGGPSDSVARALPHALDDDDLPVVAEASAGKQAGPFATGARAARAAKHGVPRVDRYRRGHVAGEGADPLYAGDRPAEGQTPQADNRVADAVPDVRGLARTAHGGLLYLVNLLPRLGLVQAMRDGERWSDRGLRWVLHQLAMVLVRIEPEDPAALVFAGLTPGTPPPSSLQ